MSLISFELWPILWLLRIYPLGYCSDSHILHWVWAFGHFHQLLDWLILSVLDVLGNYYHFFDRLTGSGAEFWFVAFGNGKQNFLFWWFFGGNSLLNPFFYYHVKRLPFKERMLVLLVRMGRLQKRSVLLAQHWVSLLLPCMVDQYAIHVLFIHFDDAFIFEKLLHVVHLPWKLAF